jgi:DNA-binding SARP family transcriptional activator
MIRVLGPIDIVLAGRVEPIGSHQVRALLGALVVGAGHSVAIDLLEAAMWGEDRVPESAGATLHTVVSRLRHVLGDDAVRLVDHSYQLDVYRDQIDALRFEDLFTAALDAEGDPALRRTHCRQALALWRGDPFGDLYDVEPFRLEAMRLDQLRLSTMELALAAELELGRHAIVTAELESAVHEHPYRERFWHLLIDALIAGDRRVEAAAACRQLRAVLAEAGLEPGERLEQLERRLSIHL